MNSARAVLPSSRSHWAGLIVLVTATADCAPKPAPLPRPAVRDAQAIGGEAWPEGESGQRATEKDDCGYVDASGRFAISRRFHQAANFSEGLARVSKDRKSGFINRTGDYVLAPTYDEAKSFRQGLAAVCLEGKGWGFIDPAGAWAVPPHFAFADSFSDGLAVVKEDGNRSCLENGGIAVPEGSECEGDYDPDERGPGPFFLIDRAGRRATSKGYHCITRVADGMAAVRLNGRWGYVDRTGKEVIAPRFSMAKPFGEGLAAVRVLNAKGEDDLDEGKWGFVNHRGKFVVSPRFTAAQVGTFSEGLLAVDGLSFALLNKSPEGRNALAAAAKQKGLNVRKWREQEGEYDWAGDLDRMGVVRLPVRYCFFGDSGGSAERSLHEFSNGLAEVAMEQPASVVPWACSQGMTGPVRMFVDRQGRYVEPTPALLVRHLSQPLVPKCRDDKPLEGVNRFTWE